MTGTEAMFYLAMAGAAMQAVGNQQQKAQQRKILNRAMSEEQDTQDKAIEAVAQEAQTMAPTSRAQAMLDAENAAYDRNMADLTGAGADLIDTAQGSGNVSEDFVRAKADKQLAEGERLSSIARQLAKVRAPGQVATDESMRRSALAEEMGSMWGQQARSSKAATLDAQSVGTPMIGQLGKIASLASMAGSMAGMGATAAAGAGSTTAGAAGGVSGMDLASDAALGTGNNIWSAGSGTAPAGWFTSAARTRPTWWTGR